MFRFEAYMSLVEVIRIGIGSSSIFIWVFFWLAIFIFLLRPFLFADAVLFDQLVQGFDVSENMDTSASVQMRWLQNPQVV